MKKRYMMMAEFDSKGNIHYVIYRRCLKIFWLNIGFTYDADFAYNIKDSLNELNKPRGY